MFQQRKVNLEQQRFTCMISDTQIRNIQGQHHIEKVKCHDFEFQMHMDVFTLCQKEGCVSILAHNQFWHSMVYRRIMTAASLSRYLQWYCENSWASGRLLSPWNPYQGFALVPTGDLKRPQTLAVILHTLQNGPATPLQTDGRRTTGDQKIWFRWAKNPM